MWVTLLCNISIAMVPVFQKMSKYYSNCAASVFFLVVWELLEWNPTQIYVIPLYSMLMLWNSKKRGSILHDRKDFFFQCWNFVLLFTVFSAKKNFDNWIHAKFISKVEVFWEGQNVKTKWKIFWNCVAFSELMNFSYDEYCNSFDHNVFHSLSIFYFWIPSISGR